MVFLSSLKMPLHQQQKHPCFTPGSLWLWPPPAIFFPRTGESVAAIIRTSSAAVTAADREARIQSQIVEKQWKPKASPWDLTGA